MLQTVQSLLAEHPWQANIQYFVSIDSTNTYAKALASQGAPAGTVVIAGTQTGGRGRMGRSFSSPADMGVYLSVILRPGCRPAELMHLTCATGVAACQAIAEACGIQPSIKWTNDLVLVQRKLGGILTELAVDPASGLVDWVVIGIGINCCQKETDFPPQIRNIACSLGLKTEDRAQVAAALIRALYQMNLELLPSRRQIMDAFRSLCITTGKKISLLRADTVRHGTALSILDDGALQVLFDDGSIENVASGEVSIRGMYGYL